MNGLPDKDVGSAIAVTGYAVRLPGCSTADQYWSLLEQGRIAVRARPGAHESKAFDTDRSDSRPHRVALERDPLDYASFDATFFELTSREAELLDPQRRLLLECAHSALEDAGEVPGKAITGAYLSTSESEYFLWNLASRPELFDRFGGMMLSLLNGQDFTATWIAYKLDLQGPAISINTACSSSLVAVHHAVNALLAHECDLAIAGGASVALAQHEGYPYRSGGIYSRVGRCRPFDLEADGTVPGGGAAVVVLKRLQDALNDGDRIRAIVAGTAVNNDGKRKVGFTAPSVAGQIDLLRETLAVADVDGESIDMIETHGTGTALGDAVEIAALKAVLAPTGRRSRPLYLGSLKANLGHTSAAAGVASLVKVVLCLEHKIIPPLAGCSSPRPELAQANFIAPATPVSWPSSTQPRLAGVSSFGIGGTNAHVIVREAPQPGRSSPSSRPSIVLLSSPEAPALDEIAQRMGQLLTTSTADLTDLAYTSATGRPSYSWRMAVVGTDALATAADMMRRSGQNATAEASLPAVWVFPGQGSSSLALASALAALEPAFESEFRRCLGTVRDGVSDRTSTQQPLLFATSCALGALWKSWGVQPSIVLGHSVGEYAAAYVAGIFSLEDAVLLVHARGNLMENCPPGAMLAVAASLEDVAPLCHFHLEIAAHNGPRSCVVAGTPQAIGEFAAVCRQRGWPAQRLAVERAFHSRLIESALEAYARVLDQVSFRPARTRMISTLTGGWVETGTTLDAAHWLAHARRCVEFRGALQTLAQAGACRILELSGAQTLTRMMQRPGLLSEDHRLIAPVHACDARTLTYERLAAYWQDGGTVNWQAFYRVERRCKHPLPGYPYRKQRHWLDRAPSRRAVEAPPSTESIPAETIPAPDLDIRQWLYVPDWEPVREQPPGIAPDASQSWLVLDDGSSLCESWIRTLEQTNIALTRYSLGSFTAGTGSRLQQPRPNVVLYFCGNPNRQPEQEVVSLWAFARDWLISAAGQGSLTLCVLFPASEAYRTVRSPASAAIEGVLEVFSQEIAGLRTRLIGLAAGGRAELLLSAIHGAPLFHSLYIGREMLRRVYRPAQPATQALDLHADGHYVLFGGLGQVGRRLARILSRDTPITLSLIGRHRIAPEPGVTVVDLTRSAGSASGAPAKEALEDYTYNISPAAVAQRRAAKELLGELSATVAADYVESRGFTLSAGKQYDLEHWSSAVCACAKLSRMSRILLRALANVGWVLESGSRIEVAPAIDNRRSIELIQLDMARDCPDYAGVARRLIECSRHFTEVLIDGKPGVDVLYPDGTDSFLLQTAAGPAVREAFSGHARALVRVIQAAAARHRPRPLRILEVGAGNGSLTREILPALSDCDVEYCFTDIGRSFLAAARRLAATQRLDWLSTRPLDFTRDPLEQGFSCGEFDLIIACNAIHVAPSLAECLARLSTLLRPDGAIVMLETADRNTYDELVWGLTPGWWQFEDEPRRLDCPLLTRDQWTQLLQSLDFGSVATWNVAGSASDEVLLLAEMPDRERIRAALRTSTPYRDAITHLRGLVENGCTVRYLQADLVDPGDIERLVEELCTPSQRIDGIIHAATTGTRALGLIRELTAAAILAESAVKVGTLEVVRRIAKSQRPAFVAVMSSMSSVLGGLGHTAYAAANACQDAVCAEWDNPEGTRWLSINWDAWGTDQRSLGASVRQHQLDEGEAVACLRAALSSRHRGQVLVSRHDLAQRLQQWLWRVADDYVEPAPAVSAQNIEAEVSELWSRLLGVPNTTSTDMDFFLSGGDSLLAVQMIDQIRVRFGHGPDLAAFMRAPTQKALINHLRQGRSSWSPLVTLKSAQTTPALFCVHPGGGSIECYRPLSEALALGLPVYGLQSRRFAPAELPSSLTIEGMAEEYVAALLTAHPAGAFVLMGYCFGGLLAYEMTRQLEGQDRSPSQLILIDSHAPGADDGFLQQRDLLRTHLADVKLTASLDSWLDDLLGLPPHALAKAICEHIDWTGPIRTSVATMEKALVEIILCNEAKNRYQPQGKLRTPVQLLRIDDVSFHREYNSVEDLGWQAFVESGIEVFRLEGPHLELLSTRRIPTLVRRLEALLQPDADRRGHPNAAALVGAYET